MPHWRDHLNSSLLGAYSLYDDKTEGFRAVDGVIKRCTREEHILGASGKQKLLVAYTSLDNNKPMKINVTIAKAIALIAKTQNPDKWKDVPVQFYVQHDVKTREGNVEGLRVRKSSVKPPPVDLSKFEAMVNGCKTLEELKAAYESANFPQKEMYNLIQTKKNELSKN